MTPKSSLPQIAVNRGGSPFDKICRIDTYGREYWSGRELQPHMGYERWQRFEDVIERAILAAKNTGTYSESAFVQVTQLTEAGNLGTQARNDYHLSRYAAYLVAMNGDPNKPPVAAAQAYFAVRTRDAELGAITEQEIRSTALARAREMVDYKVFRDMMRDNAPDYEPSSKATQMFFAKMQNCLYRHLTGMTAQEIKDARDLVHWPGRETGKDEPSARSQHRKIAKNYLTVTELNKLDKLVGMLCLRAEFIAEDSMNLTLAQWENLVDAELSVATSVPLAA